MSRARCVVTRRLPGDALDRLAAVHEVEVWPEDDPPSHEALLELVEDADGIVSLLTDQLDADLIAKAPQLRAIANYAVGTDNIDLRAASARGIAVGNTPDVLTDATADLTWALMMTAARHVVAADRLVRQGRWKYWAPEILLGADVTGSTLGIVGYGRIGRAVHRRAAGFDMRVLHTGIGGTLLEDLFAEADFVSIHCPLTQATQGLIGAQGLAEMKPSAILVNTARGAIVDSTALATALTEGSIAGAALDVVDPEPLPSSHPLLAAPNLVVTPHIGSATASARRRMADMAVANMLAALNDEPMPFAVAV
jgi:glyoxylate reductase